MGDMFGRYDFWRIVIMKRVIVLGSPGAGKSFFSRKLRDKTGIALFHLDSIWQLPDKTTISESEFDKKLMDILRKDSWIIDGNYERTLERRLKYCDTIFLLDYPAEVCLAGAKERVERKRKEKPWLEGIVNKEIQQWIIDFPKITLPYINKLLEHFKDEKEIYIFRSREDTNKYLESMERNCT